MKYTCDLNLRPRVEGKPVLLEAGIPFDEELVCAESLKELVKQGHARVYEPEAEVVEEVPETVETVEEVVEEVPETVETVEEVVEEVEEDVEEEVEEVKDKPTGIWNYKREEIEDFDIDVLNMMYKERAKEFDLSVRAMTNKDNLLDKLTSES